MLNSGKIDCIWGAYSHADKRSEELSLTSIYHVYAYEYAGISGLDEYCVGFPKFSELIDSVDFVLKKHKNDGTIAALAEKYDLTGFGS